MGLQPIVVERFGGLRIAGGYGSTRYASDPGAVGFDAATQMVNMDLSADLSQIATRNGTGVRSSSLAGQAQTISYVKVGLTLVGGRVNGNGDITLDNGWNASTAAIGTWTAGGGQLAPVQIVTLGTPTSTLSFIGFNATTLRKYNGTTLSTSVGKPAYLGVTPISNRLVQGYFGVSGDSPTGANGSPSTVFFSDPGAPETFSANNYVHLHPGDGEQITGIAVFRELLFVFKLTKAYVFYGESTDSTGQPVFNYRTISLPNPVDLSYTGSHVVAGARAVYYMARDGVYRTSGSLPERVSRSLDGYFVDEAFRSRYSINAFGERIAVTADAYNINPGVLTTGSMTFVFDENTEQWLCWMLPHTRFAPMTAGYNPGTFQYATDTQLCESVRGLATDAGAAMPSRYRTGFSDLGSANYKVVRELLVDGGGSVNAGVAYDFGTPPTGTALTLGAAAIGSLYPPTIAQARSRVATRGRNFAVQFDAASGAWSVDRFALNVRSQRPVGVS